MSFIITLHFLRGDYTQADTHRRVYVLSYCLVGAYASIDTHEVHLYVAPF
jgi:hypothetical protein